MDANEHKAFGDAPIWSDENARRLLSYLRAGFPTWASKLPKDAYIVWRSSLDDLPFTDVMRAARTWLNAKHTSREHPTIGGIRALCRPAVNQRREQAQETRRRIEAAEQHRTPRSRMQQAIGVVLAAMELPTFGEMERGPCRYPGCYEQHERAAITDEVDEVLGLIAPASARMCLHHRRQVTRRSNG